MFSKFVFFHLAVNKLIADKMQNIFLKELNIMD